MISGQDLKTALEAFSVYQLVTSVAEFEVGWTSNGVVLKDNHVIAGSTHS